MKSKVIYAVSALVCALACASGLSACAGNDDGQTTDKSVNNAEFTAYRERVINILRDNDINVNDVSASGNSKSAAGYGLTAARASGGSSIVDEFDAIVMAGKPSQAYDTVRSDRDSIFEQTLCVSLIMGDAISNYHNETGFYNIPVYFEQWRQYLEVVKSGANDVIHCYTPADSSNPDTYLTMEIEYNGANDYSFTCMQLWGDNAIYAYGNSDKQYIRLTNISDSANDASGIYYMPEDGKGYVVNDGNAVERGYGLVKDQLEAIDKQAVEGAKSRVKYNLTSAQSDEALKKYFGNNSDGAILREDGIQYETVDGQKFAAGYVALNGQSEVVIPSEVTTLCDTFYVEDLSGKVKSLYIPKSVTKIVDVNGNEITSLDELRLRIYLPGQYQNEERIFSSITVEQGSPLFKSGTGHLFNAQGAIVYVADKPLNGIDLSVLAGIRDVRDLESYNNLLSGLGSQLLIDLNGVDELVADGVNIDALKSVIQSIVGTVSPEKLVVKGGIILDLNLMHDVTLDVYLSTSDAFILNMVNDTSDNYAVTVNIKEIANDCFFSVIPKQPDKTADDYYDSFVPCDKIYTTVNVDFTKFYFEFICGNNRIETDAENSEINYGGQDPEVDGFEYFTVRRLDETRVCIYLDEGIPEGELVVPLTYCGFPIDILVIDVDVVRDKNITLVVSNVLDVQFISSLSDDAVMLDNENFIIEYEGEFDELFGKIGNSFNEKMSLEFTAQCSDKTGLMQIGYAFNPENPENFANSATVKIGGEEKIIKFRVFDWIKILDVCDDGYAYLLVDDSDGTAVNIRTTFDDESGNRGICAIFEKEQGNYTLYMHEATCGEEAEEEPNFIEQTYRISENNCNLSVTVAFVRQDADSCGASFITDVQGTIKGNPVLWENYGLWFNCPALSQAFNLGISDGQSGISCEILISFKGEGLGVYKCKFSNELEGVIISYGDNLVTRDFLLNEKYYFTEEQLPSGEWEYYYIQDNRSYPVQLLKDDTGYYIEVSGYKYEIVRLTVGEKIYSFSGDNYNISLTLETRHDVYELDDALFDPETDQDEIYAILRELPEWIGIIYYGLVNELGYTKAQFEDYINGQPYDFYVLAVDGTVDGVDINFARNDVSFSFGTASFRQDDGDLEVLFYSYVEDFELKLGIRDIGFRPFD